MTSRYSLHRVTQIDDTMQGDHSYLTDKDDCFFMIEYDKTVKDNDKGQSLILNLKKSVSKRDRPEYYYKNQAILEVAQFLAELDFGSNVVIIPAPSSKSTEDPEYDDRLLKTLESANQLRGRNSKTPLTIANCLKTTTTRKAQHEQESGNRSNPDELYNSLELDPNLLPQAETYLIFDDMITTGSTFKACQRHIQNEYNASQVAGFFIARRVPEREEIDWDFDDL